jgi:hypothetical protein
MNFMILIFHNFFSYINDAPKKELYQFYDVYDTMSFMSFMRDAGGTAQKGRGRCVGWKRCDVVTRERAREIWLQMAVEDLSLADRMRRADILALPRRLDFLRIIGSGQSNCRAAVSCPKYGNQFLRCAVKRKILFYGYYLR